MLSKSSGKEETITEVLQNRNSKKMAESIDEILNPVIHVFKLHMKRITLKKKKFFRKSKLEPYKFFINLCQMIGAPINNMGIFCHKMIYPES